MRANKVKLRKRWYDLLLASYPEQTQKLWAKEKDQFANPVAHEFHEGLNGALDLLLENELTPSGLAVEECLRGTLRIRAVQNFSPSDAVSFLFVLKKAVREDYWSKIVEAGLFAELLSLESRIDIMALLCLDTYCKCREELYRIKIDEIKRLQAGLLRKAGLVGEFSELTPGD